MRHPQDVETAAMMSPAWPRAHGAPVLTARIRTQPDDFYVEELPAFQPSGVGEHLLLTVEKRGMTTPEAARLLARWAGVAESAVGYAGMKDRHAVTRQRFSLWLPKRTLPDLAALPETGLRVLEYAWHARKLPRGALAGNRFVLVLRGVEGERSAVEERLRQVATCGVPNYFGQQRFGRQGDNVAQALAMFAGRRVRREERSLLLSAARSALFNQVLAARVAADCWNRPLDGDVWMLDGCRSVFGPEGTVTPELQARLERFDIHPTGPLWGMGTLRTTGAARALELAALEDAVAMRLRAGLEAAGLRQERRALRLSVQEWAWQWQMQALELRFVLPAGGYATTVLRELGEIVDAAVIPQ
jgi:tRNA pseudouridine13 synthase